MAKKPDENELYAHHWSSLMTLWKGCRATVSNEAQAEIDGLFAENPGVLPDAQGWQRLNFAEQCVGSYLTASQLAVEYRHCLDMAKAAISPRSPSTKTRPRCLQRRRPRAAHSRNDARS